MTSQREHGLVQSQYRHLVERDVELERLEDCRVGSSESGQVALIGGEAGVGKTALLRAWCERWPGRGRVLWGSCEPLLAPRPFGPFVDLASSAGGELGELVHDGAKPQAVASALLSELAIREEPCLVVLEDLHWADEATLDVLRLTANRVAEVPALVVISYRSDEVGPWHPLRVLIGELGASQPLVRMSISPLSLDGVRALAEGSDMDAVALYERTGGNPFFVTELLASGGSEMPPNVSDAVLARAARVDQSARKLLEWIAIAGPEAELWLLERLSPGAGEQLDECVARGMIVSAGDAVAFRHELAREAVASAISDYRRAALHQAVLEALSHPPWGEPDLPRLAHHAIRAGNPSAVLEYIPQAASRASRFGAHRESAALYEQALHWRNAIPIESRAALLEHRARECWFFTDFESAEEAQREALGCYEEMGDELRLASGLSWLSNLAWQVGKLPEAIQMAVSAAEQLEFLPSERDRGAAYLQVAQLKLADEDPAGAHDWALRASNVAAQTGRQRLVIAALMTLGWAEFFAGERSGLEKIQRAIELAGAAGYEADMVGAHVVVTRTAARLRMYDLAEEHLRAGLQYCDGRDIDVWRYYLLSWLAKLELARGRWDEAVRYAEICLGKNCPFSRIHALVALGVVRARRGDPGTWMPLDEALASALPRKEFQWIAPVAAARAEAAWLEGRVGAIEGELAPALEFPMRRGDPYAAALVYWRWRAGLEPELPADAAEDPPLLEVTGDWAGASERWRELGCPYEAALALIGSDDPDRLRAGLVELQRLGGKPAAALISRRLRKRGYRAIPRGPRPRTRENPAGLTARELEVLALLADGLRNAQIAERLIVSEKTVDHHVSAILRKLNVRTRGEASAQAARLGLTGQGRYRPLAK